MLRYPRAVVSLLIPSKILKIRPTVYKSKDGGPKNQNDDLLLMPKSQELENPI